MAQPGKWSHIYTRPTRCQDFELHAFALFYGWRMKTVSGLIYIPHEEKQEGWYPTRQFFAFTERLGKRILQSSWNLERHLKDFERNAAGYLRASQEVGRASTTESLLELLRRYRRFYRSALPYSQFIFIPFAITYYLDGWFAEQLKKRFPDRWQAIYESIAIPSKPIQTQRMVEELLAWKLGDKNKKILDRIYQKYYYLGSYSVSDPVWSKAEMLHNIRGAQNPARVLLEAREGRAKARRAAHATCELLRPYPRLEKAARIIHEYVWLRTERVDVYKRAMVDAGPFYRRFEHEFGIPKGWGRDLTFHEIERAAKTGKIPSLVELSKRAKNDYVIHARKGKPTKIVTGRRHWERYLKQVITGYGSSHDAKLIRGNTAYPGTVRGKVRILLSTKQLHTMRRGEILVANMTHPDYLPAIKKALAIITDEGGIVCHAAIIARELKIPAIIGTIEATKVFKTGDRVEVDAERGVVRKLR